MQRKRGRDSYANHVELGASVLPVAQMRKFAMTRLVKLVVVVIIGYIVYSVYSKNNMASLPNVDTMSIYDDAGIVRNKVDEPEQQAELAVGDNEQVDKRVKEHINEVFEDFRRKQEEKQEQAQQRQEDMRNEINDIQRDANENDIEDDDIDDTNDEVDPLNDDEAQDDVNNDDDGVMQELLNLDDKENIADEFEEVDEAAEQEERELEHEIEERLAGAFGDAKKEVAAANKDNVLQAVKNNAKDNVKPEANKDDQKNIELDKIIEHLEFNMAVDKMGRRLKPGEIRNLNEARRQALRHDSDHEFPPLITAVHQGNIDQIKQLISSIHHHLPGRKLNIYDLDLNNGQKKELIAICGVRLKHFMMALFPKYVSNLANLHWKPLVMQTALAEFGHIIWINPGFILASSELAPLVHESHERGVLVLGQTASYTTFAATHPDMLKFIPTDTKKLAKEPHVEIRAVFMHNTEEVHENIMKIFSACALETSCLAPPGAKWTCLFDFTGRKHADCHRYDESALNILLKNYFNFDTALFTRRNSYFKNYDEHYKPKLKMCRKISDIKDKEL